jgi:RNA polymerase sigma-32 factor
MRDREPMATGGKSGFLQTVLREPRLGAAEERRLIQRAKRGDKAAAARLITSHLRFVLHIARRYRSHGQPLADLIQEGTVGLMDAFRRFNPERDVRLATYAMWSIRAAIQDYVVRSRSLVKIGTTAAQKSMFFNLWRRMGVLVEGEMISEEFVRALAERFNTSMTEVANLARRMARPDQSLDVAVSADSNATILEQVRDDRPTPEDQAAEAGEFRFWRTRLTAALASLPPRELFIIRRRFLAEFATSREALGRELGLSKERVRQLEVRALARLRTLLQAAFEQSGSIVTGTA